MDVTQEAAFPKGAGYEGTACVMSVRTGRSAACLCCVSPNLELLGFVVLQALHYRGKSLLVVTLGGDRHGS